MIVQELQKLPMPVAELRAGLRLTDVAGSRVSRPSV
jgi:hypothetical protein